MKPRKEIIKNAIEVAKRIFGENAQIYNTSRDVTPNGLCFVGITNADGECIERKTFEGEPTEILFYLYGYENGLKKGGIQ